MGTRMSAAKVGTNGGQLNPTNDRLKRRMNVCQPPGTVPNTQFDKDGGAVEVRLEEIREVVEGPVV
jgi:hypothetical protein